MKNFKKILSLCLVCLIMATLFLSTPAGVVKADSGATRITDLTVNYRENPLSIDTVPRFGWKMQSEIIGQRQTAYEISVFEEDSNAPIYTKKVAGDLSVGILYDGDYSLKTGTRYNWNVKVWDKNGDTYISNNAYFETGISGETDWESAEFIQLPASSASPIFRNEKAFAKKVKSARLHITAIGVFEAYIDGEKVGVTDQSGETEYNHMSPGYGNAGVTLSYETYDITSYLRDKTKAAFIITGGIGWHNGYDNHFGMMGRTSGQPAVKALVRFTYEDGSKETLSTNTSEWKGSLSGGVTMNSVFHGENYDANLEKSLGNYMHTDYDDSDWYGAGASDNSQIIKNNFESVSAKYVRLSVTELGPGTPNDNENRLQIMEWEVFDKSGNNVALNRPASSNDSFNHNTQWRIANINDSNNGMINDSGYTSSNRGTVNIAGNPITVQIELAAATEINRMNIHCRTSLESFEKGVCPNYPKVYTLAVSSDGNTWTNVETFNSGSVKNPMHSGLSAKDYNVKLIAQNGDAGWILKKFEKPAVSAALYSKNIASSLKPGGEIDVDAYYAFETPSDPLYKNVQIVESGENLFEGGIELKAGQTMVIDTAQNLAAIPYIEFAAAKNTKITMKFAEVLNDGGKVGNGAYEGDGPKGSVYRKNLRSARATAEYTFAGDTLETYQTKFSFFGYRYVEIKATADVTIHKFISKPVSSVKEQTGNIMTNNSDVNRLFLNGIYGQLSNYFTTPTDCPQRDERLAWTGDLQVFANTALYNFNSAAFLSSIQQNMSTNTLADGFPKWVITLGSGGWSTGWSDAGVIVAWHLYQQTGDKQIIEENWDAIKAYLNYLKSKERGVYQAPKVTGDAYADWLAFQGTGLELVSDYYYAYVVSLTAKMAKATGKIADEIYYSAYFDSIKTKFLQTHVSKAIDTDKQYPLTVFEKPTNAVPGTSNKIANELSDVSGRYVRLKVLQTGPGTADDNENRLQIMEFRALSDSGTNLALNKAVTVSSSQTVAGHWENRFLTDGNLNFGYTSQNNYTSQNRWNPMFVTVDLGSKQSLSKIEMFCRIYEQSKEKGICVNYPREYLIQVSDDNSAWNTVGRYSSHADITPVSPLVIKSSVGSATFMNRGGVNEDNSQMALLWLLKLGLFTDDEMMNDAIKLLINNIENINQPDGSTRNLYPEKTLSVGFLGSNVITPVLSEVGHSNTAYDLLLQDAMPSWLFSVKAGATTIWERWNSYDPNAGFGDVDMNSFNHYSYGSISEWMYEYMAGIAMSEDNPGFKHIVLQPNIDGGDMYNSQERINDVKGEYESYYGKIKSYWTAENKQLKTYSATLPANTSATLYLPISAALAETCNTLAGVTFVGMKEHLGEPKACFELESGRFEFTVLDEVLSVEYGNAEIIGDVNGDGAVDIADIMKIRSHILEIQNLSSEEISRADVNKDDKISLVDIMRVRKIILV